ncbi:MAG: hypothetical protein ACN6NT_01305, partial [Comamonas sp.]
PQWTTPNGQSDSFTQEVEHWKNAWRQGDQQRLSSLYSDELLQSNALEKRRSQLASMGALSKLSMEDMSVYNWQEDAGEIRIVNLHMAKNSTATVRQYWRKQAGRWQIFSEDVLS